MKNIIRHYFPGGNTPLGFYSFYENIMFTEEAELIICIKGGPGTGKSTIMKDIGEYYQSKGLSVDYLWCSADPDSLDGIVIKDKKVAIIDGTYPHIVDPKNPGAVDEIINLGECWDNNKLRSSRQNIIKLNERITSVYKTAYDCLRYASKYLKIMEENICLKKEEFLKVEIEELILDNLEEKKSTASCKSFFASAITYKGTINTIDVLKENIKNYTVLNAPLGLRIDSVLNEVSKRILALGYSEIKFYCPMNPQRLEHIITDDCSVGLFVVNEYHKANITNCKVIDLTSFAEYIDKKNYNASKLEFEFWLKAAISKLKEAKILHDELEECYIPAMNFEKVEEIKERIIYKLESISF